MTLKERQGLAAVARTLIALLQQCDDEDFISEVVQCVVDGDDTLLRVENLY